MTQYADLLRAVLDDPADDAPRLIMADWLDEQGEGDRAEFIRCQCALARDQFDDSECRILRGIDRPCVCPHCALRRREEELLGAHGLDWVLPVARAFSVSEEPGRHAGNRYRHIGTRKLSLDDDGHTCVALAWRRGFVAVVRCRMEDWIGKGCKVCLGNGYTCLHIIGVGGKPGPREDCPHCDATGRVNAHGPAIVLAHPVERVEVTDREPYLNLAGTRWYWFRDFGVVDVRTEQAADFLSLPVFSLLEGAPDASRDDPYPDGSYYPTRAAALDALSAALLAHAKSAGAMTDCQGGR
jgi:uncharacterized protein (TIGR02996 family)